MEISEISYTHYDQYFVSRRLDTSTKKLFKKLTDSYSFSSILSYLHPKDAMKLQILSRFFYYSQIPRCIHSAQVVLPKVRLHLFNHDYIVIFDIFQGIKQKRKLKNETLPHLWNCQSLEINGKIYITGGSLANTKTYLNTTYVLDEDTWRLNQLANMKYCRDAHGIIEWKREFMIAIGSWHEEKNTRTCEIYDIKKDVWTVLPELNFATCAPGLIIVQDRYLYKLGGTNNIRKIEYLDLLAQDQWITINTSNQMGKKQSINRCLLHPLWGRNRSDVDEHQFLILGCHFGRTESPFVYSVEKNQFSKFQKNDMQIDMYRSNDVVQINDDSIFIRPFVKVGDPPENIKVLKYYLKRRKEEEIDDMEDGPEKAQLEANNSSNKKANKAQKIGNLFKNIFSSTPRFSTRPYVEHNKGQVEEVEFATTFWENDPQ